MPAENPQRIQKLMEEIRKLDEAIMESSEKSESIENVERAFREARRISLLSPADLLQQMTV